MARTQARVVVLDPSGGHNPASQPVGGGGGQFGAVSQNEIKQVPDHVANPPTHPSPYASHPRSKMSVQLSPSSTLGFRRPLTSLVKRSLTITNNNAQPIAFKVKTTAPKLYCVRPNSGRVEPGESQEVSVMLQAMKEEPPLNAKCKDKFLIQSTTITPDKETMSLAEIWANTDANEDGKVHQQKLRVTYLPAEGQTLEEEDESNLAGMTSIISQPDSNILDPVSQHPSGNGNAAIPSTFTAFTSSTIPDVQPAAPSTSEPVSREPSQEEAQATVLPPAVPVVVEVAPRSPTPPPSFPVPEPAPAPEPVVQPPVQQPVYSPPEEPKVIPQLYQPSPAPVPAPAPAPAPEPIIITKENPVNKGLLQENKVLKAEIERLKNELAVKFTQPPPVTELRRRRHSDAASESDVQTAVEEPIQQQDGVPLNIVVAISFAVFFTTYLFF